MTPRKVRGCTTHEVLSDIQIAAQQPHLHGTVYQPQVIVNLTTLIHKPKVNSRSTPIPQAPREVLQSPRRWGKKNWEQHQRPRGRQNGVPGYISGGRGVFVLSNNMTGNIANIRHIFFEANLFSRKKS